MTKYILSVIIERENGEIESKATKFEEYLDAQNAGYAILELIDLGMIEAKAHNVSIYKNLRHYKTLGFEEGVEWIQKFL